MNGPVQGLDAPCHCGRRSGDHTLDEWADCLGGNPLNLPMADVSPDTAAAGIEDLQRRLGIDPSVFVADSVVVRAGTLQMGGGPVSVTIPVVIQEFQRAVPQRPHEDVATVLYMADVQQLAAYGHLLRDAIDLAIKPQNK